MLGGFPAGLYGTLVCWAREGCIWWRSALREVLRIEGYGCVGLSRPGRGFCCSGGWRTLWPRHAGFALELLAEGEVRAMVLVTGCSSNGQSGAGVT